MRAFDGAWASCPAGPGLARWARWGSKFYFLVQIARYPPLCLSPRPNLENLRAPRALPPSETTRPASNARLQRGFAGTFELRARFNVCSVRDRNETILAIFSQFEVHAPPSAVVPRPNVYDSPLQRQVRAICVVLVALVAINHRENVHALNV